MGSKVFLSYEESSPIFVKKVKNLSVQLEKDGFQVVSDFTSLQPGQDINQFIEKIVSDFTIDHVLVLLNPAYAAKANARIGGVGKETQILSEEVFQNAQQTKIIPVILEKSGDVSACLPIFLRSRFFIDLSDEKTFEDQYQILVRALNKTPIRQNATVSFDQRRNVVITYRKAGFGFELLNKDDLRADVEEIITHPKTGFSVIVKDQDNGIEASLGICAYGIECFFHLVTQDSYFKGLWKDYCEKRAERGTLNDGEKIALDIFLKKYGSSTISYFYEIKYAVDLIDWTLNFGRKEKPNTVVFLDAMTSIDQVGFSFTISQKKLKDFCKKNRDIDFVALTTVPLYGYQVFELGDEIVCEDVAPAFFYNVGYFKKVIDKEKQFMDFTRYELGPH